MSSLTRNTFIVLCVWSLCVIFLYYLLFRNVAPLRFENGNLVMHDLTYYLVLIRAYWVGEISSIYQFPNHQIVLSELAGFSYNGAWPIGITPIGQLILAPFSILAPLNLNFVFSLWNGTAVFLFLLGTWNTMNHFSKIVRLRFLIVILIATCSTRFLDTLLLGQTTIYSAGLLMLLASLCISEHADSRKILTLSLMAGIKPYYSVGAYFNLLGAKRYIELTVSIILIGLISSAVMFRSGPLQWIPDYLNTLGQFAAVKHQGAYESAFNYGSYSNFRGAFSEYISPVLAANISYFMTACGALVAGSVAFVSHRARKVVSCKAGHAARHGSLFPMLIFWATFLLFSPHSNNHEDLLIISFIAAAALEFPSIINRTASFLLIVIFTQIVCGSFLFRLATPTHVWVAKLCIMLVVLYAAIPARTPRALK